MLERRRANDFAGRESSAAASVIEASDVSRSFGGKPALEDVSLSVARGEIHALLGPNGAGKTTLLRILSGLLDADRGVVRVLGVDSRRSPRELRQRIGLIPSGDRSFYLRLSGLENLVFFGRLHGFPRRGAVRRSFELLEEVGLQGAAHERVGTYSHGMQKRLSVARALLVEPEVLLVDEATHDLDPEGSVQVRALVAACAVRGAAVLWTTQRLDEIRGFADSVTVIGEGRLRFAGSVPELLSYAPPQRYLLRVRNGRASGEALAAVLQTVVGDAATVSATSGGNGDDFVLSLGAETALGDALRLLLDADVQIHACREEQSRIEDAFIQLTRSLAGAIG